MILNDKQIKLAHAIFDYAESFADAAASLSAGTRKNVPRGKMHVHAAYGLSPLVTLDSFSLELSLKCLQTIELGAPKRGHSCIELFVALPTGTKDAIKAMYASELKARPDIVKRVSNNHAKYIAFDSCLEYSSRVFEKIRYGFEENTGQELFYWPLLRISVRATILGIYPDWGIKLSHPTGPTFPTR